jgi:GTPase-associated system helical domain
MAEPSTDLLPAWLAPATAGNPEREAAIRAGTATLADATVMETLDMVLLAHGVHQPAAAQRLSAAIAEHDPTFDGHPANQQTQVAAAWTVAQTLAVNGDSASIATLAVASAHFCGLATQVTELPSLAARTLRERQQLPRRRQPLPKARPQKSVISDEVAALGAITGAQLQATADQLTASINNFQRSHGLMVDAVNNRVTAADEETDMLWWAISERHEGDGQRWTELGAAAPLLAGWDLARLTPFATPAPWARQLLARALAATAEHTITEAVAALPSKLTADGKPSHPLLPVLCASRGEPSAAPDGRAYPPAALAEQTLSEALLQRAEP